MALTDRQKKTIGDAVQKKIRGGCPMCGQTSWQMQDEIVATATASLGGGMAMGGPYIPMVQVICTNCGFISHHAVGVLGINLED